MKLDQILEGGSGSGRADPTVRPDKNLWFQERKLWLGDLRQMCNGVFDLLHASEESDVFATDKDRNMCYGVWKRDKGQGITFAKARPLNTVVHPRMKLTQMTVAPPYKQGI